MSSTHTDLIAQELKLTKRQVQATITLLDDGATVPFLARYRKEATGGLDEVAITTIRNRSAQLIELDRRRETVLKSIAEQGKLTDELRAKILAADTLTVLEDLYLPYKPKRRTRATIAKEKGLEPLAQRVWEQGQCDPATEAVAYVDPAKELPSVTEVLAGARDIMAEWVSEDPHARARLRELLLEKGTFQAEVIPGKETEGQKFSDYFAWEEPVATAPSHRILAMRRGEKEEILTFRVLMSEDDACRMLERLFVKGT
ncbi:MAG: Tex-like N-terminal domain-containing protein, partial [Terriglobia bacterium]